MAHGRDACPRPLSAGRACRVHGTGVLLALFTAALGAVFPGAAFAASAGPARGAAVVAGHASAHDGHRHHGPRNCPDSCFTAPDPAPELLRDPGTERHTAHAPGAAPVGRAQLPRPDRASRPLPDPPVADGDLLRSARHLGRSPPLPQASDPL